MTFLLFLSLQLFAAESIIKSKDDIVFHTPDMFKFSGIGKISEFRGIIERLDFKSQDLKMVDLYQFKTETLKVDKAFCGDLAEKIFAVGKSKLYEIKTFEIVDSNKGKVCEVYIAEKVVSKKNEETYHRFVTIGFLNAKANVLVYHPHGLNENKIKEVRKFWNNLR